MKIKSRKLDLEVVDLSAILSNMNDDLADEVVQEYLSNTFTWGDVDHALVHIDNIRESIQGGEGDACVQFGTLLASIKTEVLIDLAN